MKGLLKKLLMFSGLGPSPCSSWRTIDDATPAVGDLIVCCSPALITGVIYWSGIVIDIRNGWVTMRTGAEGVNERKFIVTYDTLWMRVPKPDPEIEGPTEAALVSFWQKGDRPFDEEEDFYKRYGY